MWLQGSEIEYSSVLKMKAVCFDETFVSAYKSTQRGDPEDLRRHLHRCGNVGRLGNSDIREKKEVRMCNVAQTVSTELASELTRWASKWRAS
jgi:hypothetical protein